MARTVFIPGLVTPKARPRHNMTTGATYTDPKYRAYLDMAAQTIALHHRGDPIDGPVAVVVKFTKAGAEVTYEASPIVPAFRPRWDLDNAVGAVLDALQQGGAIQNDRDVVVLDAWLE